MQQAEMDSPYIVYYHSPSLLNGGSGRSEYVRLVLEEAGVPYVMNHDRIYPKFNDYEWTGYPAFAPPAIEKGNFTLSQTGVICRYLGMKHGLYPTKEEDQWHAEQLNATIVDYIEEGRLSFHGWSWGESFISQQQKTKPYLDYYANERMPKFLRHFENALKANNGGHGFIVGDKVTYIDIVVFHALRATEHFFPEAWASLKASCPLLVEFKKRIGQRPRLKAYLESDRCPPFTADSMI